MAMIYRFPYNYLQGATVHKADNSWNATDPAPELSDGRDDTFTATTASPRFIFRFPGTANRTVNAIFMVTSSGLDTVTLADGAGSSTITIAHPLADATDSNIRGRRYSRIPVSVTDDSVRLSFGGTGRVYNVMFTQLVLTLTENEHWTEMSHQRIMEGGGRRPNIKGDSITIPGRAGRWKWRTRFTGYFGQDTPANMGLDYLARTIENHPNFFFYPLPNNEPTIFYPATVSPSDYQIEYVGGLLTQRQMRFTVQEL